jgi:hypothetical protein
MEVVMSHAHLRPAGSRPDDARPPRPRPAGEARSRAPAMPDLAGASHVVNPRGGVRAMPDDDNRDGPRRFKTVVLVLQFLGVILALLRALLWSD